AKRSRSFKRRSAAFARRKIPLRILRLLVPAAAASSMRIGNACNIGATRKEISFARYVIRFSTSACRPFCVCKKRKFVAFEPYQPGYIAPPRPQTEETAIDIGGGWTISGTPVDLRDPRLLAIAEAERQILEAEYDEYAASNATGAAFCRSAALILMALLLLRHALTVPDADAEDDVSTFFSLFLLRAAGFLLPCYIMAWAISILQRQRQRQVINLYLYLNLKSIVCSSSRQCYRP
ncbi:hypothetical protein Golax_010502, partial [Gossypium laxum]|nr:hypothetical protein [Gossypium laxum]